MMMSLRSNPVVRKAAATVAAASIVSAARLLTGVRALWSGTYPSAEQTLYFANHTSHGDFVLLWASLPTDLRSVTRPVAGEDYWLASNLRRFIGSDVFNALMIARDGGVSSLAGTPVDQMAAALAAGDSLIMFPEGTRNTGDDVLLPLKSGLFHLARACPQVRLVPVWIENLKRVLPKGMLVPLPLACSVRFGAPVALRDDDDKVSFLTRARSAMLDLRPEYDRVDDDGSSSKPGAATAPAAPSPAAPAAPAAPAPAPVPAAHNFASTDKAEGHGAQP